MNFSKVANTYDLHQLEVRYLGLRF